MEIRIARPTDAPAFLEIYAPLVRSTPISFESEVPSEDEMARRIQHTLPRFPWLAAVDDSRRRLPRMGAVLRRQAGVDDGDYSLRD